jgi:adenylate cyclase
MKRRPPGGRLKRSRAALLIGLFTGLLGIALVHLPTTESLEWSGLDWLFILRGRVTPPPDVCVVAIDDESFDALGLDRGPCQVVPRGLYAHQVETLRKEKARAVAFDVYFEGPGPIPG